jgi:hypothetical protein
MNVKFPCFHYILSSSLSFLVSFISRILSFYIYHIELIVITITSLSGTYRIFIVHSTLDVFH